MGKILSWGKCQITATPISGTGAVITDAVTFDTPVEGTTNLSTTQGDKTEAKVEGGQIDAVRYNANSYELTFDIRMHSSLTTLPLDGTDGVIPGEYKVEIKPLENASAPKVTINRASANVQVAYTSADGLTATYTFSSLLNESGQQITIAAQS